MNHRSLGYGLIEASEVLAWNMIASIEYLIVLIRTVFVSIKANQFSKGYGLIEASGVLAWNMIASIESLIVLIRTVFICIIGH